MRTPSSRVGRVAAVARRTLGFTMLEVLVSLVVVSLGLLGVAGMQIVSLRNSQGAGTRSIAFQQATDITDRMRSNLPATNAGAYSSATPATADPGFDCSTATCTPTNLAVFDLFVWNARNRAVLPNGYGVVCRTSTPDVGEPPSFLGGNGNAACDNAAGAPFVVKIWWDERENNAAGKRFRLLSMAFRP